MAISFVANALGASNSTTSFSITLPTTQAGDIIILEYTHRGTGDATLGGTYSGGAFTEKHDQQYNGSTFSAKTLWSRATGNHSGQTVTGSGLTNSCAAIITIYRGALASGDPLADATIVGEQNASGNETQAEITTNTNGAWVVLVVANSPDVAVTSQTCTSPGALTARAERLSTGGTDTSIAHASAEKATAGATGSFTWSQTDGASGSWAYAIIPPNQYTLTCDPGSFSLTGQSTTLTAQRKISADSASYSFSGQDVTFKRALRLSTANGSYLFTGEDIILQKGFNFSVDPGSYSFSGANITFLVARRLPCDPGSFNVTGQNAGLIKASNLLVDPGVFNLTGQNVFLFAQRKLIADSGLFSLSGQVAQLLKQSKIQSGNALYTLNGQVVSLIAQRLLSASIGNFIFTGQDATLTFTPGGGGNEFTLQSDSGSFVFTGQSAGLIAQKLVQLSNATYGFVGENVQFIVDRLLIGQHGSYVFTGEDVNFLLDQILSLVPGSFVFIGGSVTMIYSGLMAGIISRPILINQDIQKVNQHGLHNILSEQNESGHSITYIYL